MDYLKKTKEYKALTLRRQIFVRQLLLDPKRNATAAAERSGYTGKNSRIMASQLICDKRIKKVIEKYDDYIAAEHGEIRLKIIKELCLMAFSDLKDFMKWADSTGIKFRDSSKLDDKSKIISEVSHIFGKYGDSKKIKLYDKIAAMRELNKMLGFYAPERVDLSNKDGSLSANITVTLPSNGREKKSKD